ncbi:MAG: sialate O-acetylesterase [Ruminococcus sp.]|nr:sialate O-acetylesterase [Ruminococcus sp.]
MLHTDADIASGMVLQRDTENSLTGCTEPGAEVCAKLTGNGKETVSVSTSADSRGRFSISLPPVPGSTEAYEIEISSGDEQLTLTDVLFGDVFHITGQSNMELPIHRIYDPFDSSKPFSGKKRLPDCPYIREFRAPILCCFGAGTEYDHWEQGKWFASNDPQAADMSAVGYFFASELFDRFGIPIGLVNTSAGGAPIEAFLPAEELEALGGYEDFLSKVTVPGWMEDTAREDEKRCGEYYTELDRKDTLADRILAGDLPEGERCDLPFRKTDFSGRLWLWKEFDLPDDFDTDGAMLILGTLTDSDRAYINGIQTGETGYMYPPRYYPIEKGVLRCGRNLLAVRLDIYGGQGGFTEGKRWCIKSGDRIIDLSGDWRCAEAARADSLVQGTFFQGLPLSLYAVSVPAYRKKFRGLVIYQGESNCHNAHRYKKLFTRFISFYRERYGCELPVIFTQLPEFAFMNDDSWAVLRQVQLECTGLPGTAMAVTIGTGEWNDLHPINKWDVGRRLAFCAGKLIYGQTDAAPVRCISAVYKDGIITLTFSEGVTLTGECEDYFEAVFPHGTEAVKAESCEGGIVLRLPAGKPEAIRYAWRTSPDKPRLFDKEGLPVSPFRITVAG